MTEEKLINGYKCCFQDSRKAPECNFISIPIVHDAKYHADSFSIMFERGEEEAFKERIQLIGFSTHSIKEGYFAVSVFTFTYMEDDDLEFIKKKTTFFFKEKKNALIEKDQMSTSEAPEALTLYNYGNSKLVAIKIIRDYFDMTLSNAKNSIDSISITGCVSYDLSKFSETERLSLLKDLKSNNVKYEVK